MAYAVEAVDWTVDSLVDRVRWHPFTYVYGELRKGNSAVRCIAEVAAVAEEGDELYLCYRGAVGRKIAVATLPDGRKTLINLPGGDQAQSLNNLPSI